MLSTITAQLIAEERSAELQRHAATARLAAIARCCQPSTWARAARRTAAAFAALRRDRSAAAACCA